MTHAEQRSSSQRRPSQDTTNFLVGVAAVTRMIRARDKLSQSEVARRAGVGKKFISASSTGARTPA
jgi:DNA-binding XRE family transcriptional regulator